MKVRATPSVMCLFVFFLLISNECCVASPAKAVTYFYTDANGSVLATTDASGNIQSTGEYRPFGQSLLDGAQTDVGFTGHVSDEEADLVYMQARYYEAKGQRTMRLPR